MGSTAGWTAKRPPGVACAVNVSACVRSVAVSAAVARADALARARSLSASLSPLKMRGIQRVTVRSVLLARTKIRPTAPPNDGARFTSTSQMPPPSVV